MIVILFLAIVAYTTALITLPSAISWVFIFLFLVAYVSAIIIYDHLKGRVRKLEDIVYGKEWM